MRMFCHALTLASLSLLGMGLALAAPPPAGSPQAGLADGPPSLTEFRINNGEAWTADPTLKLTWVSTGRAPTHWRVSTSTIFTNAPWYPVPMGLPYKLLLDPATDGVKTYHLQLMNDLGQSGVRSAQIEFRAPPLIQSFSVQPLHDHEDPTRVRLAIAYSGKVDRYLVTPTATIGSKQWLPWNGQGPIEGMAYWVQNVPPGGQATLHAHVRRDDVGQHSMARSFVLTVPRSNYVYRGSYLLDFFVASPSWRWRGPQVTKLSADPGECRYVNYASGSHHFAAQSSGTPVRCRITLFQRDNLGFAWELKSAKVSYGDGSGKPMHPSFMRPGSDCRITELVSGGAAPHIAIEVYFPGAGSPIGTGGSTLCQLDEVIFYGPTGWPLESHETLKAAL